MKIDITIDVPRAQRILGTPKQIAASLLRTLEQKTHSRLEMVRIGDQLVICPKGTLEDWEERISYGGR